MRAALESYGVELKRNGLVYERIPLQLAALRPVVSAIQTGAAPAKNAIIPGWADHLFTEIDKSLELRLIRFTPHREEGEPEYTRWPFWVERPLEIAFQFGDQWWSFKFSPGKTYEDRAMEPPAA
jgi:hypothetical protein